MHSSKPKQSTRKAKGEEFNEENQERWSFLDFQKFEIAE